MSRKAFRQLPGLVLFALFFTVASYLTFANRNAFAALVVGVLGAVLFAIYFATLGEREGADGGGWRRYWFDATLIAAGVAVLVYGAFAGNAGLALSGLPLMLLGLILFRRARGTI